MHKVNSLSQYLALRYMNGNDFHILNYLVKSLYTINVFIFMLYKINKLLKILD